MAIIISQRQRIAMALLVLVGILGSGAVLMSDRGKAASHAERSDADPHDENAHAPNDTTGGHDAVAKDAHAERELRLTEAQIRAAGIGVALSGPGTIEAAVEFHGEIRFDEDRTTHVVPRLAGVVESVHARLGQRVRQGEVLAVIASTALSEQRSELLTAQRRRDAARATHDREKQLWEEKIAAEQDYLQAKSALQEADIAVQNAAQKLAAVGAAGASARLNRFEIRAPLAGTVVEKHLGLGEAVKEDASIFTVSDLDTVWAEFAVAPKDLASVRVGQRVVVSSTAFTGKADGEIAYVGALLGEQTRSARARVSLKNPDGAWRPGLFVTVAVRAEPNAVPLAVGAEAVQAIDGQPMLFVATPAGFAARPVAVGRSDGRTVEIVGGLQPGERYAASNAFVLKSELGKASAEHGH